MTNLHTNYQFGLSRYTFFSLNRKSVRDDFSNAISLTEFRNIVSAIQDSWQTEDLTVSLNQFQFDLTQKIPTVYIEELEQTFVVSRHFLKQCSEHLKIPNKSGRFISPFNFSEASCILSEEYREFSTSQWNLLVKKKTSKHLFRTKIIDGNRTITAMQSLNYAPISDLEVIDALLQEFPDGKVVYAYMSSEYSNFGIVSDEEENAEIKKMYDIHNSDCGTRALHAFAKFWIQICSNGMMGFKKDRNTEFYNRHYGEKEEILDAFKAQLIVMHEASELFIEMYLRARTIKVHPVHKAIPLKFTFNKRIAQNVLAALNNHDLIASPLDTVAHIVDAVTLAAQSCKDPMDRHAMEAQATAFLVKALDDHAAGKPFFPKAKIKLKK